MAAASSSSDNTLPMNTILHLITIRLNSTNYLLWTNQMVPLLTYQHLLHHVDGSSEAPPSEVLVENKSTPNPLYSEWISADQRTIILLHASLTEEAFSAVVGHSTARNIWLALEAAYGNSSMERVQNLRDQLRLLSKGSSSVAEYGRIFKSTCDQLAAIGHTVSEPDKSHWFLCGLGGAFETFSTAIRASRITHAFSDLLAQAESHEMFLKSIHTSPPQVAFSVEYNQPSPFRGGRGRNNGGRNFRGGRGRGRRPRHCQLCRQNGHFADSCPSLSSFAANAPANDEELAKAFLAKCNVSGQNPDWYVDSGASDHMVSSSGSVTQPENFGGNGSVQFGNGSSNETSTSSRKM